MKALALVIFLFCLPAQADLHLLGGIGINGSIYKEARDRQNQGLGLNFKTDLVYEFSPSWAVELGSQVKFNRVEEYFIWNTQFTAGGRFMWGDYYTRLFYGRAPTVFFLDDAPRFYQRNRASRVQIDGPVYGVAIGKYYPNEKNIFFAEASFTFQELNDARGIMDDETNPEIVFRDPNSLVLVYGLQITVGMVFF